MRTETTTRELYRLDELKPEARDKAIEHLRQLAYEWAEPDDLASEIIYGIADALKSPGWDTFGEDDFPGIPNLTLYEWDLYRQDISCRGCLTPETAPALPWGRYEQYNFAGRRDGYYPDSPSVYSTDSDGWVETHYITGDADDEADTLDEAVADALAAGLAAAQQQLDYLTSKAGVIEMAEANEFEFTADGVLA